MPFGKSLILRAACAVALLIARPASAAPFQPLAVAGDGAAKYRAFPETCAAPCEIPGPIPGTAPAFVAATRAGDGLMVQATYEPQRRDAHGNQVRWIGDLRGLRVGRDGAVDTAQPLWSAAQLLAELGDDAVASQRDYDAPADSGRHILTFLDLDLDGSVDAGEVLPFTAASFAEGRRGVLNVQDAAPGDRATAVTRLVAYVRGKDQPELRLRQLDRDGDGQPETQRLGDIVHSQPAIAGAPAEAYDLLYGDRSYAAFREKYRSRRNVVYVGANDGMLHAFNAGFYDARSGGFQRSANGEVAHPLGGELWAYVPFNLLPHLAWLADPAYAHAWYVDGRPRLFDARIFPASGDATHPHGWGTLLVVGFRFGGGDLTLPRRNWCAEQYFAAFGACNGDTPDLVTRSAFVIFDVTDPEQPPRLLAEFTGTTPLTPALVGGKSAGFGFTTSTPALIAISGKNATAATLIANSDQDQWLLAMGSGPSTLAAIAGNAARAESIDAARLFFYDLRTRAFVAGHDPLDLPGERNAFVGDPVVVDWDLDFKADALYFGTAAGSATAPAGKLWKLAATRPGAWADPAVLLDPEAPVLAAPAVTTDEFNRRWVLGGTGRWFGPADAASRKPNHLFGVIDRFKPDAWSRDALVAFAGLLDVTGAAAATTGAVLDAGGWKKRLDVPPQTGSERVLFTPALLGDVAIVATHVPGTSRLQALDFRTGADKSGAASQGTRSGDTSPEPQSGADGIQLDAGTATAPVLHLGGDAQRNDISVFTTGTGGTVSRAATVTGSKARSGEIDWRERVE